MTTRTLDRTQPSPARICTARPWAGVLQPKDGPDRRPSRSTSIDGRPPATHMVVDETAAGPGEQPPQLHTSGWTA